MMLRKELPPAVPNITAGGDVRVPAPHGPLGRGKQIRGDTQRLPLMPYNSAGSVHTSDPVEGRTALDRHVDFLFAASPDERLANI